MTRFFLAFLFALMLSVNAASASAMGSNAPAGGTAITGGVAVVDVERIFRESTPGRAGEAHLQQVLGILQKGLDDLHGIYQGMEDSAEARAALREGQAALERQLAAERLAMRQILTTHLEKVIQAWFIAKAQDFGARAVAPASIFFAYSPVLDITDTIMQEMNREKPTFPALPSVTVRPPSQATQE